MNVLRSTHATLHPKWIIAIVISQTQAGVGDPNSGKPGVGEYDDDDSSSNDGSVSDAESESTATTAVDSSFELSSGDSGVSEEDVDVSVTPRMSREVAKLEENNNALNGPYYCNFLIAELPDNSPEQVQIGSAITTYNHIKSRLRSLLHNTVLIEVYGNFACPALMPHGTNWPTT